MPPAVHRDIEQWFSRNEKDRPGLVLKQIQSKRAAAIRGMRTSEAGFRNKETEA